MSASRALRIAQGVCVALVGLVIGAIGGAVIAAFAGWISIVC